ncbi:BatD family protein [Psychromonas antarctica]|uniref:BatD family protein n=1 Tax=Psychromonas antarctica TaxID=67573 RepID=UPI001EE7C5BB|nr:BatD family protein [Psychromonas antarctica]MCG6200964.1 BatD family protein [Psychromonas antarctica]
MQIKKTSVIALFISLFLISNAWATSEIQASVSDNQVSLGDQFILTIDLNDSDSDFQLDTRPLEQDFTVYRPSQNRSSKYINGEFSQHTQWQITLQPKSIGELTIPPLKLGTLITKAITISVKNASDKATKTPDNQVFMENRLDKSSAYLGQQLILTTQLFISQEANELALLAPELAGADIKVYGQDKKGQTIRNGIRYQTITRQFEINAKQAGQFTISSPLLRGSLREVVSVSDWHNRIIAKPINIRGDSLDVEIKAKPATYQGEWLISEDVRLFEEPALNQQTYHVGEPITRNITLQVASVDSDKLPTIKFNYPKSLRFYPDQDQVKEGQANGLTYGVRSLRHAIIANQAGDLTLPEIKLPWWNSQTDKQEFAVLPAQKITILAAEKSQKDVPMPSPATPIIPEKQLPEAVVVDNPSLIYWQIAAILLLLALILLFFYHLSFRRSQVLKATAQVPAPLDNAYLSLQEALKKRNAQLTYQALLNFAQSEFPTLTRLTQLVQYSNLSASEKAELLYEIKRLEMACSNPSINWSADPLSLLIEKHRQQKKNQSADNIMQLNPQK